MPPSLRDGRSPVRATLGALLIGTVLACGPTPPPTASPLPPPNTIPSPTSPATASQSPANSPTPTGSSTPSAAPGPPLVDIGDCEDYIVVPCPRLNATVSIPISGSSFSLTYSSDRVPGWTAGTSIPAAPIGLGGWSLDVLASYDPANQLLQTGDGARRKVTATPVTADGQPALAVPSVDASEIYVFDTTGRQLRAIDGFTGMTTLAFAWGDQGLESITEPGDRQTRILRDAEGTPVQIVTSRGMRSKLGVLNGWLAAVVDPSGGITHLTTNASGLVEVIRDAAGARHVLRYDSAGRIASIDGPNGQTVSFSVAASPAGIEVQSLTGAGRGWDETIATNGDQTVRTYTDRTGTLTSVAIQGTSREVTTADGTKYDMTLSADAQWGMSAPVLSTSATSPAGRTLTIAEERQGAVVDDTLAAETYTRQTTVGTGIWTVSYDPTLRRLTASAPDGRKTDATYDDQDRVVNVATQGQPPVSYEYDSGGRLALMTMGSGASARQWRYDYDLATGAVTVTDPVGNARVLSTGPNGSGTELATPSGSEVAVAERDAAGHVVAYGGGALGLTEAVYRADGRLASTTLPPGDQLSYTNFDYDADGVVTGFDYPDGGGVDLDRDGSGRPTAVKTDGQSVALSYDVSTGALTGYNGSSEDLTRTFDGREVIEEVWSGVFSATFDRQYDGLGQATADDIGGQDAIQYQYDAAGRLIQAGDMNITRDPASGLVTGEHLGAVDRTWRYNEFAEIVGETVSSSGKTIYDLEITRDGLGRVTQRAETIAGGVEHTAAFTYDDAGRLASATYDGAKTAYAYDASGDLIKETGATDTDLTYDARGELLTAGARTFTYDDAGRLASASDADGTTKYDYDSAGRLTSVTLADGRKVEYVVDGMGRRVARMVDGQLVSSFAYADSLRPAAELDSSGQIAARYVYDSAGLSPAYDIRDGKTEVVVGDDAGTPRLIVDASTGAIAEPIAADAWGSGAAPPPDIPFGLAGGLVDPDTGLVHFGARDYDPATTRWTAPDPLGPGGGDANPYRYAHDDPVNRIDQPGTCDVVSTGASAFVGLGGAFSIGAGLVTGGPSLGVYFTWGEGVGFGAGAGVGIGCELQDQPGNPLNQFGGAGTSTDFGIGVVSPGYDQSFNDDGSTSLSGGHVGVGPGVGGAVVNTHTSVFCIFGCGDPGTSPNPGYEPPPDPPDDQDNPGPYANCVGPESECSPSDQNPGPDPDDPQNACNGAATCDPDDPAAPDNGDDGSSGGSLGGPGSAGDPHLHNAAGLWFDFMAVGEFTALRSDSGDLNIQVRQVPYSTSKWVSVTSQVAISDNGDRLTFSFQPLGVVALAIDGQPAQLLGRDDLPHGGFVTPETGSYLVGWPDGSLVRVFRNVKGLDISTRLMPERIGTLHGLLGPYTGDTTQDFIEAKDGTRIPAPALHVNFAYDDLYRTFGDSWRISADESLFDYAPGETTATFDDRTFPDPNPPPIDPATSTFAESICRQAGVPDDALEACIFDVARTGDPGFAVTTAAATRPGAGTIDQQAPGAIYRIAVGDTVAPDQPAQGAGVIAAPGEVDLYPFTLATPQTVYLTAATGCTTTGISWSVLGPTGEAQRSDDGATSSSICFDLKTFTLPAGTFTIRVAGQDTTGNYSFTLTAVAGANTFPIALGDQVAQGKPGPGAGEMTTAGESDRYSFSVSAPQVVYLDAQGDCGDTLIHWALLGPSGETVKSDSGATDSAICFDLGEYTLPAGNYTITVSTTSGLGTYAFQLWAVSPTATFQIALDQPVSSGQPSAGAGEVTTPGETDLYTFNLGAPQIVYLDAQADCGGTSIHWSLLGSDGASVPSDAGTTDSPLCFDLGTYTLPAGNFTIRVTTTDGLGPYGFEVWGVPPTATFPITVGQTVSTGVPGPGAGGISTRGEVDLYTFSLGTPQTLVLHALGDCGETYIHWTLLGADGTAIPAADGTTDVALCFDLGSYSLPAGSYTVKVSSTDGVGPYSFVVAAQ